MHQDLTKHITSNLMLYRIREHLTYVKSNTDAKPYELRSHMKNLERLYSEQLSYQLKEIRVLKKDVRCCRERKQMLKNILESNNYAKYQKFVSDQLNIMENQDMDMLNRMPPMMNEFAKTIMGVENGRS